MTKVTYFWAPVKFYTTEGFGRVQGETNDDSVDLIVEEGSAFGVVIISRCVINIEANLQKTNVYIFIVVFVNCP